MHTDGLRSMLGLTAISLPRWPGPASILGSDHDVDGGGTAMTSPAIALTGGSTYTLSVSYYMAHGSNSSSTDYLPSRPAVGGRVGDAAGLQPARVDQQPTGLPRSSALRSARSLSFFVTDCPSRVKNFTVNVRPSFAPGAGRDCADHGRGRPADGRSRGWRVGAHPRGRQAARAGEARCRRRESRWSS